MNKEKINNKMNREIKFRAWNKIKKVMYEVQGLHFGQSDMPGAHGPEIGIVKGNPYFHENFPSNPVWETALSFNATSILMQYTGLKDKNRKEIYEGDVVKYLVWGKFGLPTEDNYTEEIGKIEWDKTRFTYTNIHQFGLEVIGNIWENPELLK